MSVIENAIKRLQATREGAAPTVRERSLTPSPRRAEPEPGVPGRIIPIDLDALRAAGLFPPAHQERELAQQFRQIKRPLINNALGRGVKPLPAGNLLMIASAVPGEGKTFTSLNLALSMRLEEDVTVLLVDGDVVNPRLSQVLGADDARGLLDLIKDPALPLSQAILQTDVPGLSFLPAGHQDPNATELLASARMSEVVTQLAGHDPSRLVLFDSAPLLLTTESQALTQSAGQIVLVVRADDTPQHVVLDALESLAESKSVSLVLNQSMKQPHAGYYYRYAAAQSADKDSGS
ncbi:MAG: protein tyrosine kinase [Gammaproteobacteria bacterium]|nr:protein tyrosine kinase [Gammaproteobacteria bacterium]